MSAGRLERADRRPGRTSPRTRVRDTSDSSLGDWLRVPTALALVVAGAVHLAVAGPHAEESVLLGVGMGLVGALQLGAAGGLLGRVAPRTALIVGALVSLAALVVYVMSRTGDLPFMPAHSPHEGVHDAATEVVVPGGVGNGMPVLPGSRTEEVGAVDALCAASELAVVAVACLTLPRRAADVVTSCALLGALTVVGWRFLG